MELLSNAPAVKQSSIRSFFLPRGINHQQQQEQPEILPETAKETEPPKESEVPETFGKEKEPEEGAAPRAVISVIQPHHIQPLKRLNTLLLPTTYPDSFYNNILSADVNLSYVILWNTPRPSKSKVYTIHKEQQVVGGIVCRLEQYPDIGTSSVYIQSLALLSPYRSQGLATTLLETVIRTIVQLPPSPNPTPSSIYAHAWTENTEALDWYKTRAFIADPAPIQNYYSRLRPGTAFLLRRHINPSDYLRHNSGGIASTTTSKRSSEDWEMVESPNMVSKPVSAPAALPFIAPPPTIPPEPPQKSSKKAIKPAQTYLNFPPAPTPTNIPASTTSNLPSRPLPATKATAPSNPASRPSTITHTESFQNRAPDREWNDLPLDFLGTPSKTSISRTTSATDTGSGGGMGVSATSSRSSSSSRTTGKKKRSYPAAAFGNGSAEAGAR